MILHRVTSSIPSWWLAVSGAFLVGVSATVGPLVIWDMENDIQINLQEIEEREDEMQKLWNESVGSDRRMASVGILLALADQTEEPVRKFVLDLATRDASVVFSNSFTVIKAANAFSIDPESCFDGTPDGEGVMTIMRELKVDADTCKEWYDELEKQELDAFRSVVKLREEVLSRILQDKFHEYNDENSTRKIYMKETQRQIHKVQLLMTSFSLIGLLLVLLKDVPIWKDTVNRKQRWN